MCNRIDIWRFTFYFDRPWTARIRRIHVKLQRLSFYFWQNCVIMTDPTRRNKTHFRRHEVTTSKRFQHQQTRIEFFLMFLYLLAQQRFPTRKWCRMNKFLSCRKLCAAEFPMSLVCHNFRTSPLTNSQNYSIHSSEKVSTAFLFTTGERVLSLAQVCWPFDLLLSFWCISFSACYFHAVINFHLDLDG